MTPGDREAARAALYQGRAVYARLDQIRGPEDAAADIIDLWSSAEGAMRALLGDSSLSGQQLVKELRQRGSLNLDQANTIAAFWDARSRVDAVNYRPTLTDVGYARAGYNKLSEVIETTPAATAAAAAGSMSAPPTATAGAGAAPPAAVDSGRPPHPSIEMPTYVRRERKGLSPLVVGVTALAILLIGSIVYLIVHRTPSYDKEMATAIDFMRNGQTEAARSAFTTVVRDYPQQAEPHVFLARLARSDGDMASAHRELETAIRTEPGNPRAQREMGLVLLAENRADLAVNFLVRAVRADTSDAASKGYLGCALMRLNRTAEGQKFLDRAGNGTWSTCATTTATTIPQTMRAPASTTR